MTNRLTYDVDKIVALKKLEITYRTFKGLLQGPTSDVYMGTKGECRQKFDGPLGWPPIIVLKWTP